jgi:hypothetical protein
VRGPPVAFDQVFRGTLKLLHTSGKRQHHAIEATGADLVSLGVDLSLSGNALPFPLALAVMSESQQILGVCLESFGGLDVPNRIEEPALLSVC